MARVKKKGKAATEKKREAESSASLSVFINALGMQQGV